MPFPFVLLDDDVVVRRALDMVTPTVVLESDLRAYPSDVEGNTGFSVSRFRPGLWFRPVPWLTAVSSFDLLGGERPSVLDAFVLLRPMKGISFDVGQSKPPMFPSFVYESDHTLPFPDRAPVVSAFRVQRDVGADVHLAPDDIPIEAWFRVGSGSGSPAGNAQALPALYGALDFVTHSSAPFNLRAGVAGMSETVLDRDGIHGVTPMDFTYFRPITITGHRLVSESHVIAWLGPVRVTFEGALAKEQRSKDTDGNPSTPRADLPPVYSAGMTAEIAWTILGKPRASGRMPTAWTEKKWCGGALEIAGRFDRMWLGRGALDVELGGMIGGAGSVKWWPIDFVYVDVAAYGMRYDGPPIEEPDRQVSWGFLARTGFAWGHPGQPSAHLGSMLMGRR